MNPTQPIRHLARIMTALAATVVACVIVGYAAVPTALAVTSAGPPRPAPADSPPLNLPPPAPGWDKHPSPTLPASIHTTFAGGMPGWQIIFIAVGGVLLATTAVFLLARARTARRRAAASPA
jgi:hypothetical protein